MHEQPNEKRSEIARVAHAEVPLGSSLAGEKNGLIALDAFLAQLSEAPRMEAEGIMKFAVHEFVAQGIPLTKLQLVMELDHITEDKSLRLSMYVQVQKEKAELN